MHVDWFDVHVVEESVLQDQKLPLKKAVTRHGKSYNEIAVHVPMANAIKNLKLFEYIRQPELVNYDSPPEECIYFKRGFCRYGDDCWFLHVQSSTSDDPNTKRVKKEEESPKPSIVNSKMEM